MLYGVGREGFMMWVFIMCLYYLGLNVYCLGDMICLLVGEGDLFIVSVGLGLFSSIDVFIMIVKDVGIRFIFRILNF